MTSWRTLLPHTARTVACVPVLLFAATASAQRPESASPVTAWLILGPLVARNAAFAGANDSSMLAASRLSLEHGWPAAGRSVPWLENDSATWTPREAVNGGLQLAPASTSALVYAATYLDVDRFTRGKLTIDGVPAARRRVTLDGVPVGSDSVTLRRGKHVVVVQLLQPAGEGVTLSMRLDASVPAAHITASLDPRHPVTLDELMKTTDVRDIAVDPLGQRVAWVARRDDAANDRSLSVVEVHDLATGRMLAQLGGGGTDASSPRWSRDGARLAYQTATDRTGATGRDLWIWSAERGQSERVLRAERGLSGVEWGAKGDWLYFTSAMQLGGPESFKPGDAQRLTEVWDRWSFWPEKAQLNALSLTDGTRLKLVGDTMYSVEGARLSPDGRRLVFARSVRTTTVRPWLRAELWVLDLSDISAHKLLDLPHEAFGAPTEFAWSPDGNAIAFCASAAETLAKPDSTFSVYENELYATNVQRPSLVRLSGGFVPAVTCNQEIAWNARDNRIYASADAGARTVPVRTRAAVPSSLDTHPALEAIAIPGETMMAYGLGPSAIVAAIQTPVTPSVVYRIPLGDGPPAIIGQPSAGLLAGSVQMPSSRSWEFTNSKGTRIEAWYWLPPGFDSTKTYPMIVHYYGGTLPMKKSFDERLVWFASNGYVVFMLNPAGTPGYGQQFANLHINDWGYPA
ncbi:MAG TPA: prolyl oligopeptidase family serine peptidase, partial [Gemmatimonadaceae bacterium]